MNNIPDLTKPQRPDYGVQHLLQYITNYTILSGQKPKEIPCSKQFLDWYESQLRTSAQEIGILKAYGIGMNQSMTDKEFEFKGIKLVEIK